MVDLPESAKEAMLARIRAALVDAPESEPIPDVNQHADRRESNVLIAELVDRLRDYKATVEQLDASALPAAIAMACARYTIQRLVVPADIPMEWLPAQVDGLRDEAPLSSLTNAQLDASDGVLTGCAYAIAQTGTIILDGGARQGRRALSLVPDRHLCVVRAEQVVGSVPEAIAHLRAHPTRPITFISGPSATSDIELSRVEGVHGPRTLHVFLVLGDFGDA
jgi:L-lactate dehydrogenase complex protein LldG